MRRTTIALSALAACALPAHAAWLEFNVHMIATEYLVVLAPEPFDDAGFQGPTYAIDGWMVFDTDEGPLTHTTDTAFPVADFELTIRRFEGAGDDPDVFNPDNASASIVILPSTRGVRFRVVGDRSTVFTFDVPRTSIFFTPTMTSLHDDPGDYALSGGTNDSVLGTYETSGQNPVDCEWTRAGGQDLWKLVRYHVRETTVPDPEPCGPADIDQDGDTDIDDIELFVDEFLGGCA